MNDERISPVPQQDLRYETLRELGQRYELGELSDEEFKRLKRQILHGAAPDEDIQPARMEVLVATYSRFSQLDYALDLLHARARAASTRIIDAALINSASSGTIRVRIDYDLTRPLVRGQISIVSAICGLLFPLDVLLPGHRGTPVAASFDTFVAPEIEQAQLRAIGRNIPPGTTSILVVCWTATADLIIETCSNADTLDRHVLGGDISSAVRSILLFGADLSGHP